MEGAKKNGSWRNSVWKKRKKIQDQLPFKFKLMEKAGSGKGLKSIFRFHHENS